MVAKAGLKAGLIGAAVLLVLTLLNLIKLPEVLACICCGAQVVAYLGAGVLAGLFLKPPRNAGAGAGAGAIAGVVSGLVAAVAQTVVMAVQWGTVGSESILSSLDPATLQQLTQLGIDPQMLASFSGAGGVALASAMCCAGSLAIGAALGAIGGAIFGAAKSN